jgi:hypothetical protein
MIKASNGDTLGFSFAPGPCLRSLEIDDELKSGGKLYRQIGRLRAFENPINQSGSTFVHISQIRLAGHEATSFNCEPLPKQSGQPIVKVIFWRVRAGMHPS